jgi:multimeric flavodoxin WrbA
MKIICVNGSPKGKNSNSHRISSEFLEGARKAGAEVETVFLAEKKIGECKACLNCWIKTPGKCIQKDDMAELLESVIKSDIVVFATPVYADNVTGIMKIFIDRMIPAVDPRVKRVQGETVHVKRYKKYPKIVVISNSGFPEQTHFQTLRLYFRRLSRNMHSEVIGEIYRGGGEILRVKNPLLKSIIGSYMKLVRKAGEEIVQEGRLSEKTRERLERPLVPHDRFVEGMNKYFEKRLSELPQKGASD